MYRFGLLVLTLVACARGSSIEERIVGGSDAGLLAAPWQVSLQRRGTHFCGGSIIDRKWILTAAHCVHSPIYQLFPFFIQVVVGTNKLGRGGHIYRASNVIIHPKWNPILSRRDIALIELGKTLLWTFRIRPIALPTQDLTKADYPVTLTGWGTNGFPNGEVPDVLQKIKLRTLSQQKCLAVSFRTTDSNICTLTQAGEGVCRGDSGGPLVADGVQVGIVSWGTPCAVGKPDVYTRVWSFVDWISETIAA